MNIKSSIFTSGKPKVKIPLLVFMNREATGENTTSEVHG